MTLKRIIIEVPEEFNFRVQTYCNTIRSTKSAIAKQALMEFLNKNESRQDIHN